MKNVRWSVAAILVLSLMFSAGCSEDDNPVDGGTTPVQFNDLNSSQKDSVAVEYFAGNIVGAESIANDGIEALTSGEFSAFSASSTNPRGPIAEVAIAPEGWSGPNATGWYTFDTSSLPFVTEISLRWTPDLWADDYSGDPATKVEVNEQIDFTDTETQGSIMFRTEWWVGTNEARDLVSGASGTDITLTGDGSFDYSVDVSWSDVTVALDDYAGSYTSDGSFSFVDPEQGQVISLQNLHSEFTFIVDGSGTGSGSIASIELIRYVFDVFVPENLERTGRYYLLSEGWAVPHEFVIGIE